MTFGEVPPHASGHSKVHPIAAHGVWQPGHVQHTSAGGLVGKGSQLSTLGCVGSSRTTDNESTSLGAAGLSALTILGVARVCDRRSALSPHHPRHEGSAGSRLAAEKKPWNTWSEL